MGIRCRIPEMYDTINPDYGPYLYAFLGRVADPETSARLEHNRGGTIELKNKKSPHVHLMSKFTFWLLLKYDMAHRAGESASDSSPR